jgi:hypothetical protein
MVEVCAQPYVLLITKRSEAMQIIVRNPQIAVEEDLRSHIGRRLEFSLGRFSPRWARSPWPW